AIAILQKYHIDVPEHVLLWLKDEQAETLKPGDPVFKNTQFHMISTPNDSLQAAHKQAVAMGLNTLVLGDDIEGESREVAKVHAGIVRSIIKHQQPVAAPCIILSGGETTVTLKGSGRGGRNAEFLLSLANCLQGMKGVYALAADTDGIDGSEDNAGAFLSPQSWDRGIKKGIDAAAMLENNDGYSYFEALGDLLITGPTLTNVNDFRAILVLPEEQ
ncbi:MAG: MOFRL family protein, partial [Pseudomonadales bacterium]